MLKEILINFVLLPTLDSITEPEYVNQTISWLCEDAALNNEAFLTVVKSTENVDELEAVKAKVGFHSLPVCGRGRGGGKGSVLTNRPQRFSYPGYLWTQLTSIWKWKVLIMQFSGSFQLYLKSLYVGRMY